MPDGNETTVLRSQPLSKELIAAKALEIADRDGIENLSIRKLAGELDKTAMSLYRYFDSIEEIKHNAIALAFTEVDTGPIPGERWDDTTRRTTSSIREMYLKHRHAHFNLVSSAAWSPSLEGHTNRIQKLHRDQGIPDEILSRFWRIIDAFLSGFVINELTALENESPSIPSEEPEWMPTVEQAYTDQAFHDGVEIIIAGVCKLAAPDPCEWYTPKE